MAAYGALVSLMHIIDRLQKHPSPPISIDKQQVESLTEIVTFLQDFLDAYISPVVDDHEADPLERRIADAVYAAEDVIESQIVLQIHNRSPIIGRFPVALTKEDFYHDLQQVIEKMNLIKKEAMEIAAKADQLQRKVTSTHAASSSSVIKKDALEIAAAADQLQRKVSSTDHAASSSTVKESMMVGFDEVLLQVLDKLTGGQRSRQIIPIMGMGGIGKTTLAHREYWMRIEQNLNSIVITNIDEFCLKILRLSYTYLPNYLKPCFLYMGVFEEDRSIRVSMLKKLWISEGFLKPVSGKCMEKIGEECLKELVDRNLILVDKLGEFSGNVKYCKIHDLLRDLCLKEVEKHRFYHIVEKTPSVIDNECRRVVFRNAGRRVISEVSRSLSHARSIICVGTGKNFERPHNFRLLRTFKAYDRDTRRGGVHFLDSVFQLVNSRHLAVRLHRKSKFPSSINLLWNLSTLIVDSEPRHELVVSIEIWKLHQLRHLECMGTGLLILPDPPSDDIVIMENLQTLRGAKNLYLNEEVVKRIPNLKKLLLIYDHEEMEGRLIKSFE